MVEISKSDDVRIRNRKRVISAVRRKGVLSRTDIGAETGLSAATVSAITSDLIEEGILAPQDMNQSGPVALGRGRPKVGLALNASAASVCAVYVQYNYIVASVVDYSGETIGEHVLEIDIDEATIDEIRNTLFSCIEQSLKSSQKAAGTIRHIAVGFQGVTDVAGTEVLWTPISDYRNIPVKEWLENHFGVSAHVANDCDMIARAVNWRQPEKYGEKFAAVLLAHGVGMGLFLWGRVINGTQSSGIEFGHINYMPDGALCRCGNRGCIEAYAGDYAIYRRALQKDETSKPPSDLDYPDLDRVAQAVARGDEDAIAAIRTAGSAIGTGLAGLRAIVDAFPIVLIGRGAAFFDIMEEPLREALSRAPGDNGDAEMDIACIIDEQPVVKEGCAITALVAHDEEMAARRKHNEAAE